MKSPKIGERVRRERLITVERSHQQHKTQNEEDEDRGMQRICCRRQKRCRHAVCETRGVGGFVFDNGDAIVQRVLIYTIMCETLEFLSVHPYTKNLSFLICI